MVLAPFDTPELTFDPRALPLGGGGYPEEEAQYKLCVCVPSGLLFRVGENDPEGDNPRSVSCDDNIDWRYHPCNNLPENDEFDASGYDDIDVDY